MSQGVTQHRCTHCGTKRTRTNQADSFPKTRYVLPDGIILNGKGPNCEEVTCTR